MKQHDLGKESIGKLIFSLSVPMIISQIVNLLYNMVDRIYIGRLPDGELAMAALGVSFPMIAVVAAFAQLFGNGGAPLSAIRMGEKRNDKAEQIMTNSFVMLILIGAILTVTTLIFRKQILLLFGADNETLPYAMSYLTIYAIGTIFVQLTMGMNAYITCQGFTKISMCTVLIGAILNIILDPIFIFALHMGVSGAALATILSQGVSCVWALYFLFGKKSILKIRKRYLRLDFRIVGAIAALGISPFIMQATESLVQISFNTQMLKFGGNVALGGLTIMYSLNTFISGPLSGLAQGAAPIISYNYGARNLERVKKTFSLMIVICLGGSIIAASLIMIFSEVFASIFIGQGKILEFTTWALRIFMIGMTIFGLQIGCQNTFMALGQAKISLVMALLRKVFLLIPLIYILPYIMENKVKAVLMAEPIADATAAIVTTISFIVFYHKKLKKEIEENPC